MFSIADGPCVLASTVVASTAVCKRCSCDPNDCISTSRDGCAAVILSFAGLLAVGVSGVTVLDMRRLRISCALDVGNFSEARCTPPL